jgi:hypothetical protein
MPKYRMSNCRSDEDRWMNEYVARDLVVWRLRTSEEFAEGFLEE